MNLVEIIARHPGDQLALIDGDDRVTYAELRRRVAAAAAMLVGRDVRPGDRVGVVGDNSAPVVVSMLAVLATGAVLVPLNPRDPVAALEHELAAVGAAVVVVGPGAPPISAVTLISADELVGAASASVPFQPEARALTDLAVLLFTSGTAGAPKAAMLTHGNLIVNQQQAQSTGDPVRHDDMVLGALPLFHVYGLNSMLGVTLNVGGCVVLVRHFLPAPVASLIAREHVTVIPGVPTIWQQLAAEPSATAEVMSSIRSGFSGAATLTHETFDAARRRWNITISEGYGLTEASPIVTTSSGDAVVGSIGRVLPGIEVRLVDNDGEDALVGDEGEIWLRGPNVFAGYWQNVAATAQVLTTDGWLKTGDIAVIDDDGRFYLVDRAKDLIIVSGFNVFPAEVESVLADHPGVGEAAVIGVPSAATGEAVKAFVVLSGEAVSNDDLVAHCRARIARYKCPTQFSIVDQLPKGTNGKVLRRVLR